MGTNFMDIWGHFEQLPPDDASIRSRLRADAAGVWPLLG